jgi:hypothetical protein
MKYIVRTSFLLLVVGCLSCSKLLDKTPTDFISPEAYYSTEEELQTALLGVYDALGNVNVFGNNYLYMFNTNTDESYGKVTELVPSYQYDAAEAKVNLFWQGLYMGIERANLLLANIDKVQFAGQPVIKGEALFLRAYYYFLLVSNYGAVPLKVTPTFSVTAVNMVRTPVRTVYEQIVSDMTLADTLLKDRKAGAIGFGGRLSRTAVQGCLARVCMYMAGYPLNDHSKYEEARNWAKKVIDSKEHSLNPDYKQVFINYAQDKYDVKESIWELEFWGNNTAGLNEGNTYTGRFCGVLCSDESKGFSAGYIYATRKLYDSYELNPASTATPNKESYDLRRDWNCAPYTWGSGSTAVYTAVTDKWKMCAGKWRREYETYLPKDKNYTPQNFPMLRYSDVLLLFAEAENEVNEKPTQEAYDAINLVRRRAYGLLLPTPPNPLVKADLPTGLDKIAFLQAVKDERARELCFEAHRRLDLIRWGTFITDMKDFLSYARSNGGTATTITTPATMLSARNVLLPLPQHDMSLNKLLIQNPGY